MDICNFGLDKQCISNYILILILIILFMNTENGLTKLQNKQRIIPRDSRVKIDICKTQYPLIRSIASNDFGWAIWGRKNHKTDISIFWNDTYITEQFVKRLKPYQKINHFPRSCQIGKKNLLTQNIKRAKIHFSSQYNFYPETWVFPQQIEAAQRDLKQDNSANGQQKWFIVKPAACSQGKGIFLTKKIDLTNKQPQIIQKYIMKPLLIQQYKFDTRIYVLIKSLNPLKIFKYCQGLVRLSTCPYSPPNSENCTNLFMHLTNYAINKQNPCFKQNTVIEQDFVGHKRSLSGLYKYLEQKGCDIQMLDAQIDDIIVKTVMACYHKVYDAYREERMGQDDVCFEILGFDVIIDENFKPWLLQVNHSPSFCTDSPLDYVIKRHLILDTLILININGDDRENYLKFQPKDKQIIVKDKDLIKMKRRAQQIYQQSNLGGYTKIYPNNKQVLATIYDKLMIHKKNLFLIKRSQTKVESGSDIERINIENRGLSSRKRNALTIYSRFKDQKQKKQKQHTENLYNVEIQTNNLEKDVLVERDKRRFIEPMRLNNVNINFLEDIKSHFQQRFYRNIINLDGRGRQQDCSQSLIFQSKIADGRADSKKFDNEIRSRVQKMKLARLKINKTRNKERQFQSSPNRVVISPLKSQLRIENKYF